MTTHLELFADYHQIHLQDDGAEGDFGDVWNDQTVLDGLAITEDALAIGTSVNVNVAVLAGSLRQDLHAVTAGLTLPYSSGIVEGHVNRIKTIKRQMYGRASFTLPRARILLQE